jgi:hypothetical protein
VPAPWLALQVGDVLTDIDALPARFPAFLPRGVRAHRGFGRAYDSIREQLDDVLREVRAGAARACVGMCGWAGVGWGWVGEGGGARGLADGLDTRRARGEFLMFFHLDCAV